MYDVNNWPFKWFGVWKEYGTNYQSYPSIKTFVNEEINNSYDKDLLCGYLKNGIVLTSTSRKNFPSPFNREVVMGSISFRTDGTWIWLDNIVDFIQSNNLIIPQNWLAFIRQNNFTIPEIPDKQLKNLEWPSL